MLAVRSRQGTDLQEIVPSNAVLAGGLANRELALAWVLIAIGAFLRIYQYAWNRSLFIDEAAFALNLRTHSFAELVGRLDHAQFAPLGFLYLQKVLHELFGASEYVLRAPALVAGLVSLFLFLLLARQVVPLVAMWLAVGLFSVSRALVFWSSDAKPYAFDVLASLVLTLLALNWLRQPTRRASLRFGLAGVLAAYFSTTAVFMIAGFVVVFAAREWRTKRAEVSRVAALCLLALPAVIHSLLSLSAEDRAYFKADWWEGFMPWPFEAGAWSAYSRQLMRSVADPLGFDGAIAIIGLLALVAGAAWIARRRPDVAVLLFAPILVTFGASVAGIYPIGQQWPLYGRVLLFLAPIGMLAIAASVAWLSQGVPARVAAAPILLFGALPAVTGLPFTRAEVRRALQYVEERAQAQDVVYLYYATALPFAYYQPDIAGRIIPGSCHQGDRRQYVSELQQLQGTPRVWVVLGYNAVNEHALFLDYLARNATLLDSASYRLSEARLYDMRAPFLHEAAPELVHPDQGPYPGTACRGVFATSAGRRSRFRARRLRAAALGRGSTTAPGRSR